MRRTLLLLVVASLAAAACNTPPGGLGIGRPNFTNPPTPALIPVAITQVFAPVSSGTPFVQLENVSGATIDFNTTTLTLVSRDAAMDVGSAAVLGGDGNQRWGAGNRRSVALPVTMQVHASAGELGVFHEGAIQGYASWGQSAGASTDFGDEAAFAGAPAGVGSPALPFPVDDAFAVNVDPNVIAACVSPDPNANPAIPASCTQATNPVYITRVAWPDLDPNGGFVEVYNNTNKNLDLYGLQICTPNCTALTYSSSDPNHPAGVLQPKPVSPASGVPDLARAVVYTGHSAPNSQGLLSSSVTPAPPAGEVYLLRPAASPSAINANDLLAYVRYGNTNPDPAIVTLALERGLWSGPSNAPYFSATPASVEGESIVRLVASSSNPANWEPSASPPQTTDPGGWTSCSFPAAPATPAPNLVIQEIANTSPPRLHIQNTGTSDVSLAGLTLALGNPNIALTANPNITTLKEGDSLWVELQPGNDGCTAFQNICWNNATLETQEATLLSGGGTGTVLFHVQWGSATPSVRGQAAANVGLWPLPTCRAPAPPPARALVLGNPSSSQTLGEGAGDYTTHYPTFP